ncbi:MAG: DNA polymerase III subunit delta' [Thiohalocapsa sp.]
MNQTQALALSPFEPLPWLQTHWQRLWQSRRDDRLGHALLLTGPAGIGKRHFADLLAAGLMCTRSANDGLPCGTCADCQLIAAGNHPDLVHLGPDPESKSGEIKVDAVRELCSRQSLTANRGPRAVLRIAPAEAMNLFAANSLLKTLEEPTDSTLLILISEDPSRLPATVLSRCQRLTMLPPNTATAVAWLSERLDYPRRRDLALLLRLAHDAPLRVWAVADDQWLELRSDSFRRFLAIAQGREDPVTTAAAWQQQEAALVLEWLGAWISDLLRMGHDSQAVYLNNPDLRAELATLTIKVSPIAAHRFLQQILQARALATSTINKQLLFESLLVRWARLTARAR